MNIYDSIGTLKGVGPKVLEKFNKVSIFNILDLLLYFPRDYEYCNANVPFLSIDGEEKNILTCVVKGVHKDIKTRNRKTISTIEFDYSGHKVYGKWFNQPYVKNNFKIDESYNLSGKFKRIGNTLEIINPLVLGEDAVSSEIIPKYQLKGDLSEKLITKLISGVLDKIYIKEVLPKEMLEKYKLCPLDEAIREIHFPKNREKLQIAVNRLKFQELFTYSLKLLMIKKKAKEGSKGISFPWTSDMVKLKESLPFNLTDAQTRVVREILRDQKLEAPMNRLVQGDVGSGKTIVALIAIFNVYCNGYKSALMVPTEILANQHYVEAKKLLEPFGVQIELLTGSTKPKEKERIKQRIRENEPLVVIGTHALIQEDVEFNKLGLIVTDEQHRFGVEQRSKLINKGRRADVLVMTATPIPRTLALYIYSDLDISAIDELPPGRKKIDTRFFLDQSRNSAYKLALDEVKKGRQVYIVCPLIEEDEDMKLNSVEKLYNELSDGIFRGIPIEILHGKMKPKEKDEIINRFKKNETKAIISTTVIEVGVNVPNASVMIIENAERFGLAQLHQLRGRVGRGSYESYCILIAKAKTENTKKRMEIMTSSTDGFYISEEDLKLRGSGEMFGRRQSGDEEFILANIYDDMNILRCAKSEAKILLDSDEEEKIKFCNEVKNSLERWSKYICFN